MSKDDDYIKEKELPNQPRAIPTEELITLVDLIKTNVCKITCKDGTHGTGFFCNIPIGWSNILPALITNNHVLNINDIQPGETIKFSLNNDNKQYNILIDNTRKTYTNEFYDVTIIQIKENDKIDEKSFFDLDKQIFEEDLTNKFKNRQIYLLHYPKGIKMEVSSGLIKSINEEEERKTIYHLCSTSGGSSGSPIINTGNFKVIGIHKGAPSGAQNYNLGTILKEPIEKFNEEMKINKYNNEENKNNKDNKDNIDNKDNSIKDEIKEKDLLNEYNKKINYKFCKDPRYLKYKLDINKTNDSHGINDTFEVFISYKDSNEYLISPNIENYNLDIYLLKDNQLLKSLKGHNNNILSVRYFINTKDYNEYVISSDDNRIVIVRHITKDYNILHSIDTKYSGPIFGCFLSFPLNTSQSFIIVSTKHYSFDNEKSATKIYSLDDGKFIKYLNDSNNYSINYLLSWINKKNNKYYIIQIGNTIILINDLLEDELYAKLSFNEKDDFHDNAFIYSKNNIDYLYTCSEKGFIYIWDLYRKQIFNIFYFPGGLITMINWNDKYSIICDGTYNILRIVDMEIYQITSNISGLHQNTMICIKKILHPIFGESLLISGRDKLINLFN